MALQITKCIYVQNRLQRQENIREGNPPGHGMLRKQTLAVLFWPESTPAVARVSLSRLIKDPTKKIDPDWVLILKRESKTDYAFVLGHPSKYDEIYEQLRDEDNHSKKQRS